MDELNCWKYVPRVLDRKQGWLKRFGSHMQKVVSGSSGREEIIVRRQPEILEI